MPRTRDTPIPAPALVRLNGFRHVAWGQLFVVRACGLRPQGFDVCSGSGRPEFH
jgi:hypothetical protein